MGKREGRGEREHKDGNKVGGEDDRENHCSNSNSFGIVHKMPKLGRGYPHI